MKTKIQNIKQKFNQSENEVRIAIMNFIIDNKRAFNIKTDNFSALLNIQHSDESDFENIINTLQSNDGMVTDEEGNVNFIYPVSALPTNHKVILADGREFTAMCAIDAIGAAFTFLQDTEINSKCSICGEDIRITIKDQEISEYYPHGLQALTFTLGEISNWAGSC